jgi:hypothetical protein
MADIGGWTRLGWLTAPELTPGDVRLGDLLLVAATCSVEPQATPLHRSVSLSEVFVHSPIAWCPLQVRRMLCGTGPSILSWTRRGGLRRLAQSAVPGGS